LISFLSIVEFQLGCRPSCTYEHAAALIVPHRKDRR
jgi:hypothetical protein